MKNFPVGFLPKKVENRALEVETIYLYPQSLRCQPSSYRSQSMHYQNPSLQNFGWMLWSLQHKDFLALWSKQQTARFSTFLESFSNVFVVVVVVVVVGSSQHAAGRCIPFSVLDCCPQVSALVTVTGCLPSTDILEWEPFFKYRFHCFQNPTFESSLFVKNDIQVKSVR